MSDYAKIVDYAAKDALLTGNPSKIVKGTEIGADFDAVAVAVATKANSASPVFTGISSFAVGAVGAPSIYMTGYATTGWYNIGANNWGFAVSGAKVLDVSSTGLAVAGAVGADGVLTIAQASAGASRINMTGGYGDKMGLTFSNTGSGSYNSLALVETQGATPTLSVMGVSGIAPNADLTTGYTELATFTYGIGLAVTGDISVSTKTPASAGAAGVVGTITWDSNYIYVCTAANTWKRVAIATW